MDDLDVTEKAGSSPDQSRPALTWDDISVTIGGKDILKNLTGSLRGGEMLAVLGPSGAGKSTLLDALANHTTLSTGSITLDGVNIKSLPTGSIAYVEQHDALFGVLTVRETVYYSARLW
jgi:ABC-type multidrug transport system ATPase subunit